MEISEKSIQQYLVDTSHYVPDYVSEIPENSAIQYVINRELSRYYFCIQDILNQFNIDTATWGLKIYENKYGLPYNSNLNYEDRRKLIKAKMRSHEIANTDNIIKICELFADNPKVKRHDSEGYFEVLLETQDSFSNFTDSLIQLIDDFKPAHLGQKLILMTKHEFTNLSYLGSAILSKTHHILSSDLADNYSLESTNNLVAGLFNTSKYVLTNDLSYHMETKANANQASANLSTSHYILR